jgi:predicted glycoside hydrolase/deacetylase ChbG (UPF0249 family)
MKRVILCADDYGQNESISQAIVELLQKSSLSAVSCLTTSAWWPACAELIKPYTQQIDIGLHFNLTEGRPLSANLKSFYPLTQLILTSQFRLINKRAIAAELNAQIDAFMQAIGKEPDFIDGHQHVHQFPVIRDILLDIYEQRFPNRQVYVRSTLCAKTPKNIANRKQWIIHFCGAVAFKKMLLARNIPHNHSFSGIYDLSPTFDYAQAFATFLASVDDKGLIMCHPGFYDQSSSDVIGASRDNEFKFFNSSQFNDLLTSNTIQLSRFNFDVA